MLGFMRKHMKFFFVFFWLVIISFILWGVGGVDDSDTDIAVTVGKYNVGLNEYRYVYERLYDRYKDMYKEKLDEELLKKLDLKKKAVEDIIERKLLLQEAKTIGIEITDEEIRDNIRSYPAFQKDGKFNENLYQGILRSKRLEPEDFWAMEKEIIIIGKLLKIIDDSIVVTDEELKQFLMEKVKTKGQQLKEEDVNNAKEFVKGFVRQEKLNKTLTSYIEILKAKTKIVINEKILS